MLLRPPGDGRARAQGLNATACSAGAQDTIRLHRDMATFAQPVNEVALGHNANSDARRNCQVNEIAVTPARSIEVLSYRCRIGVVVENHGYAQSSLEEGAQ